MLKKLCRKPGCCNYRLDGHNYCEKHLGLEEQKEASFSLHVNSTYKETFHNSRKWRNMSHQFLNEHPYCARCGEKASVVHHNYPAGYDYYNAEDFFNEDSLIGLCKECHDKITIEGRRQKKKSVREPKKLWY